LQIAKNLDSVTDLGGQEGSPVSRGREVIGRKTRFLDVEFGEVEFDVNP
jgi:hypothetical protein